MWFGLARSLNHPPTRSLAGGPHVLPTTVPASHHLHGGSALHGAAPPDGVECAGTPVCAGSAAAVDRRTKREHGVGHGVAEWRSVPPAPERAVAGRVHPQPPAPPRRVERLPDHRPARPPRRRRDRRCLAGPLQVVRRRRPVAEHAHPGVPAGHLAGRCGVPAEGLSGGRGPGRAGRHQRPLLLQRHRLRSGEPGDARRAGEEPRVRGAVHRQQQQGERRPHRVPRHQRHRE